jgi:hypothetical protein
MPYIKKTSRYRLLKKDDSPQNAGELNYMITRLIDQFARLHGSNYDAYNTVIGVLECAKMEMYRRVIIPYENEKIKENGDVYRAFMEPNEL